MSGHGLVAANLAAVRTRIEAAAARAGRDPDAVTLVGASKTVPVEVLVEALAAGLVDLGENRAQELLAKAPALTDGPAVPRWHFIGTLQRNKVRALAPWIERWHSIDRVALGETVAKHAPGASVLVEVNLGDEPSKAGCAADDVPALVAALRGLGLAVDGLMTIPPEHDDPRRWFAQLADLGARIGTRDLSMGMSHDFEVAIEEGATIVRIGRAIFGPRAT